MSFKGVVFTVINIKQAYRSVVRLTIEQIYNVSILVLH